MAILRQVHKSPKLNNELCQALDALKSEAGEEVDLTFLEEEDVPTLIAALDKSCRSTSHEAVGSLRGPLKYNFKNDENNRMPTGDDGTPQNIHPLSGRPVQWESQVKMLLLAGFPIHHVFVETRLQQIRDVLTKQEEESRCSVPRSRHAFVVADHSGILRPNEIFYQSSVRSLRDIDVLCD